MPSIKHEIRNEAERGIIVQTLVDWGLEWIPFREVKLQLIRRAGYMLDDAKVEYHLQYLQGAGYAEVKTLRAGRVQVEFFGDHKWPNCSNCWRRKTGYR